MIIRHSLIPGHAISRPGSLDPSGPGHDTSRISGHDTPGFSTLPDFSTLRQLSHANRDATDPREAAQFRSRIPGFRHSQDSRISTLLPGLATPPWIGDTPRIFDPPRTGDLPRIGDPPMDWRPSQDWRLPQGLTTLPGLATHQDSRLSRTQDSGPRTQDPGLRIRLLRKTSFCLTLPGVLMGEKTLFFETLQGEKPSSTIFFSLRSLDSSGLVAKKSFDIWWFGCNWRCWVGDVGDGCKLNGGILWMEP